MTLIWRKMHNNIGCPLPVITMLDDVLNKFVGGLLDGCLHFSCVIVELVGKMSGASTVTNLCITILSVIALIGLSIALGAMEVRVSTMIDVLGVTEIGFAFGIRVDVPASVDADMLAVVMTLGSIPTRASS